MLAVITALCRSIHITKKIVNVELGSKLAGRELFTTD